MKVFVILLAGDLKASINVTENSILGVARALDPPFELYNML